MNWLGSKRGLVVSLVLIAGLASNRDGHARRIPLTVEHCPGLRVDKMGRLLDIERAGPAMQLRPQDLPRVSVHCRAGTIDIEVHDPITRKRASRSIPSPPTDRPGAERVVAIAASELILASWMELLTDRYARSARQEKKEPATPSAKLARHAAQQAVSPAKESPPSARWALAASGGVRFRDLSSAWALFSARIRGAWRFAPSWRLFALFGVELGSAGRAAGDVDVLLLSSGVGAAYVLDLAPQWSIEAHAAVSGVYTRATGRPVDPTLFVGDTLSGAAADALAGLQCRWKARRWAVALGAEGGVTWPAIDAVVIGDDSVVISGFWTGVSVEVETRFF